MKDFSELLQEKPQQPQLRKPHSQLSKQFRKQQRRIWDEVKDKIVKASGPFILPIFTGPFNTASILLQVTQKRKSDAFARKIQASGKQNIIVRTGIMGDNKIYKPFQFKGYNQCLTQLGKQGVRGLYKGNLTGIILGLINSKIRTKLYEECNKVANFSEQWKSNLLTILTCTAADFLTLPLLFCQTRLVMQNSLSNFKTYNGWIDIIRNTSARQWFSGASILLLKNTIFTFSWISYFPNAPLQSFIFSTALSHILTYPFMTIIRQLESNHIGVPMMNQRSQNVRTCIKRIWTDNGFTGFYRGFLGYSAVHIFLGFIMVEMNMRTGFFTEMLG